jgi:type I restriction enzyme S subunit
MTLTHFADVVHLNTDRIADPAAAGIERYVGLEHIEPENLHIRSWGLVAEGTTFTNHFKPRQVLFGKRRAYQRKVAVADFEGMCSGDIYVFESKDPDVLLPELLPFICQSEGFYEYALKTSAGSLSPRTNWTHLAEYEFPLPPIDEQRRIAGLLWAADDTYEAYKQVKETSEITLDAFLHQLISSTNYPRAEVGSLSKFTSGKSIKVTNLPQESSVENPIPVFGGNGIAGYTDKTLIGVGEKTVIVGRVGQYCGKVYFTTKPCWISDNALYAVAIDLEKIDVEYLALILEAAKLNRVKIGNYLPLLNQKVIHSREIPLPSLKEQKSILAKFRTLKQATISIDEHLIKHQELNKKFLEYLLPNMVI